MADAAYRQRVLRDRVNNRNENVQALLRSTHAFPSLADLSGPSPQTEDTNSTGKNRAAIGKGFFVSKDVLQCVCDVICSSALKDAAIAATNKTTTSSVVQSASAAPAPASTSVYHPMSLANQKNALRVNAAKVANVTSHSLAGTSHRLSTFRFSNEVTSFSSRIAFQKRDVLSGILPWPRLLE